jgi:hypothetical protein
MNRLALTVALALAWPASALAQLTRPAVTTESGVFGEAYRISGRDPRRPEQTLRAYLSPTISWMGLTIGANLLWSTENRFTAQTLNRLYVNPRWRWGQVHAGDYVPTLSRFTAQTVRVRGGGIELQPGRLRIAATGGRVSQAGDLSVFDAATTRTFYGGLVGYGSADGTFIEISAARTVDDTVGTDTVSVAPQENLVGAVAAGVAVGPLRLKGEWSSALFSRDTRASELDSIGQPAWTENAFTPRLSSRLDHAWSGELRLAFRAGQIGAQVEQVGPGYTTLGNPYLPNDRREIRVFGRGRVARGRLTVNLTLGLRRDNLTGDKRGTTFRRTGTLAVTAIGGGWSVTSASVLLNGLRSDPTPVVPGSPDTLLTDSFRLRNVAIAVVASQQVRLGGPQVSHTITLSYAQQIVDDDSPRFDTLLDASSRTLGADWGVTLGRQYTISARGALQHFRGGGRTGDFPSAGLGLARRSASSPWTAALNGTYTELGEGRQLRLDGSAGYRFPWAVQIAAQVRHTDVSGVPTPFRETVGTLRVTRRF